MNPCRMLYMFRRPKEATHFSCMSRCYYSIFKAGEIVTVRQGDLPKTCLSALHFKAAGLGTMAKFPLSTAIRDSVNVKPNIYSAFIEKMQPKLRWEIPWLQLHQVTRRICWHKG